MTIKLIVKVLVKFQVQFISLGIKHHDKISFTKKAQNIDLFLTEKTHKKKTNLVRPKSQNMQNIVFQLEH